ncbi:glycosyltransferase family 1 protein [Thalassotalea euphylliae]|uniref:Glycosyltransferase family 1 protein n=1 Tax=Thalassotalea euphylliae TaxID=1655234 RepID=A0A3E0TNQ2_9GAMM|nr:glycosyltransferase family 1 protein [Thalassotalea euphylliae]REL26138.1 glycosyltransferase family 1 protein [Thalassotalea euphylliae]
MKKVFVSAMAYGGGKSGVSVYINNVVRELCRDHSVDLLLLEGEKFPVLHPNINIIRVNKVLERPIVNSLWHLFVLPFQRDFNQYDLVLLPAGNQRLFCRNYNNLVVTFHDLSQFHIANKYDTYRTAYIKKIIPFFLRKMNNIVAISESTKADIMRFYNIPAEQIHVNHNGFSAPNTNLQSSGSINKIEKKFILYVARLEHPGKNHLNLLKAYQQLPPHIQETYDLVLPGQDWSGSQAVKEYHASMASKANVHFLGFVSNEQLEWLYSNASLYAFPSFFEGFGLPLLEAMSYKIPVVCSDIPPLREVGGDAVKHFDPESVENIADTIVEVLANDKVRDDLVKSGELRLKRFSWRKHVENLLQCVQ